MEQPFGSHRISTSTAPSTAILCVKTALSLYPVSLCFFPLRCARVPAQPGPVRHLSWPSPGGPSQHCQLLQFQTQLFSSVLRQMESLITFYRLGRVQNAINSQRLSFTAASPARGRQEPRHLAPGLQTLVSGSCWHPRLSWALPQGRSGTKPWSGGAGHTFPHGQCLGLVTGLCKLAQSGC